MGYRILIIKTRGIGDVIRTTPLLVRLKKEYPVSYISWITETPEIVPLTVDEPIRFDNKNIPRVLSQEYDLLINLDKDMDCCALASVIQAKKKKGFILENGKCVPADVDARSYFMWGVDDAINKKTKRSYQQHIFEVLGVRFNGEPYAIPFSFDKSKRLIGLNTGCGDRWRTRLWSEEKWIDLAKRLKRTGYEVLILGGAGTEDEKNRRIASSSKALYFGPQPLKNFIFLIGFCDALVTTVTMALHVAIALKKKVVVLNNIFNRNEFELYGSGRIVEPAVDCVGCYKETCKKRCMESLYPKSVVRALEELGL